MQPIWIAWALAAVITAAYGVALWWWVGREAERPARLALVAICAAALVLRVVYFTEYPAGLNEDEPKNLACSMDALPRGAFLQMACNGVPFLFSLVFAVPLAPVLGFTRWTMRFYSIALSVLSPAAGYAVGRGMRLGTTASLAFAALIAVLPWSLFYGRVSLGGELVFHQLLLVAAVARLVWRADSGWREALLGSLALCLLLYGYYAGRAMIAVPLIGAVLAPGLRRRAWCVGLLAIGVAGWLPYWWAGSHHDAAIVEALRNWRSPHPAVPVTHPGFADDPVGTFATRMQLAVRVLYEPVAQLSIWTIPTGALHPWVVLGAAAFGLLLTSFRRKLFLLGGFVAGVLPGVLSAQASLSTHRIMMAFPFVALSASAAVAAVPWRTLRRAVALVLVALAAASSVRLYFSSDYWTPEAARAFDGDRTALIEHLQRHPPARTVFSRDWGYFPRMLPEGTRQDALTPDTWWPPVEATYAFDPTCALLAPIYERYFPGALQSFGDAFLVNVAHTGMPDAAHGLWQTIACDGVVVFDGIVPAVFTPAMRVPPARQACRAPAAVEYTWRARWNGPDTPLELQFHGGGTVEVDGRQVGHASGFEQRLPFTLGRGSQVALTVTTTGGPPHAMLLQVGEDRSRQLPNPDHLVPDRPRSGDTNGARRR